MRALPPDTRQASQPGTPVSGVSIREGSPPTLTRLRRRERVGPQARRVQVGERQEGQQRRAREAQHQPPAVRLDDLPFEREGGGEERKWNGMKTGKKDILPLA